MNLFDLLNELETPVPADVTPLTRDQRVRAADGRLGTVVLYVAETERACVRFSPGELPVFVPRLELEIVNCPHRTWTPTETLWFGEAGVRLTETCTGCGEIRGRA